MSTVIASPQSGGSAAGAIPTSFHQGKPPSSQEVSKRSNEAPVAQAARPSTSTTPGSTEIPEEEPEVDIVINNVVCSFNVRCHLNLRDIALRGLNVEYRRENGMVTMKLRRPYTTASMWSSGKITCTGANSEDQAHTAARKYARFLQKLGFNCRFRNYRVVNVLGTCTMPFAIKITQFSQEYREASYEPELHPGVTYRIPYPKATLKIFSTGSITVTAPCVANVQKAVEHIYPLVHRFRKPKTAHDLRLGANVAKPLAGGALAGKGDAARGTKRKNCRWDDDDHDLNDVRVYAAGVGDDAASGDDDY